LKWCIFSFLLPYYTSWVFILPPHSIILSNCLILFNVLAICKWSICAFTTVSLFFSKLLVLGLNDVLRMFLHQQNHFQIVCFFLVFFFFFTVAFQRGVGILKCKWRLYSVHTDIRCVRECSCMPARTNLAQPGLVKKSWMKPSKNADMIDVVYEMWMCWTVRFIIKSSPYL
jgi:hypothetical protein